jgi:hypothetical protein
VFGMELYILDVILPTKYYEFQLAKLLFACL